MSNVVVVRNTLFHKFVRDLIELVQQGYVEDLEKRNGYPKVVNGFYTANLVMSSDSVGVVSLDIPDSVDTSENEQEDQDVDKVDENTTEPSVITNDVKPKRGRKPMVKVEDGVGIA